MCTIPRGPGPGHLRGIKEKSDRCGQNRAANQNFCGLVCHSCRAYSGVQAS